MSGVRAPLCEAAPVRLGVAARATEALLADLGSRGTSLEVEVREVEGEFYTRTELLEPEDSCGNQFVFRDTDSGAVTTIQRRWGLYFGDIPHQPSYRFVQYQNIGV